MTTNADIVVSYQISGTATPGVDYTITGGTVDYTDRTGTFTIPMGSRGEIDFFTINVIQDDIDDTNLDSLETIVITLVDGSDYDIDDDNVRNMQIRQGSTGQAEFALMATTTDVGGVLTFARTKDDPDGNVPTTNEAPIHVAQLQQRNPGDSTWSIEQNINTALTTTLRNNGNFNGWSYTIPSGRGGREWSVRFRYRDGLGVLSPELRVMAVVSPAKPMGFTAEPGPGSGQVTLRWMDPGDGRITSWQYDSWRGTPGAWGGWRNFSPGAGPGATTARISGLNNDTQYGFRIRARAGSLRGVESDAATATPVANPPPAVPQGLTATPGDTEVVLTWDDPSNSSITGYEFQQRTGSSWPGSWTAITNSDADTTSHTVTSLANGTAYEFRLRAVNDSGSSTPTAAVSATPAAAITVTVARRDDTPVTEGTAAVFTVTASRVPSANLTVNLTVAELAHADFVAATDEGSGKTQTIASGQTTANFSVPTVADTVDEPRGEVTLTVNTGTGYVVGSPASAFVAVRDNDPTEVTLSLPDAAANEGSDSNRATLRLALNRPLRAGGRLAVPLGFAGGVLGTDFTLALSGSPTGVALSGSTVTFTGSNDGSATAAEVLLTAAEDADAEDDTLTVSIPPSSSTGTPRLTATNLDGGATGSRSGDGQITVNDNDAPRVTTAQPGDRQVTEGSTSDTATFTVVLNTLPSSDVTVTVTAPTGLELDGPDAGNTFASNEALTFTTSNWSTAQTVTVRATDDSTDSPIGRELTVTYSTSSSDSDYNGLNGNAATVTVGDDDATTVTLAGAAGNITEGETKTFTITLNRGLVNGEALPVPLIFTGDATRGTDYTTACPTSLPTGVACANLDSGNAMVTFTGPSTGATATTVTLTLSAATDDTVESGGETVDIGLGTLNANSGTGLGGGASGTGSLSFRINDPSATDTPQRPPAEDDDDDDDPPPSGGGGSGGSTPSLPRSAVSVSAGQMVTEGGEALFRITANPAPTGEITVRVRVSATGDFVDGALLGEQSVTLSASAPTASLRVATIDDRRNEADGTVTVTVLAGGGYTLSQASASLAVTDDDTPALVLTPEMLTVDEGGSATYTVALATEPAGNVTVTVTSTNGEVTTARNTLTFTPDTWNVAQPVTVSAGQDADAADDRARLDHRARGGGYDSVTGRVAVTVMDDDTPGLILTPAALTLAEGASASYTVALATEPTGNVTVSIAGTGDVTVDRSTLSFTSRNWNTAQAVTAFAAPDEDVANDLATLAHRARGGDYSSVTGSVEVTVTDAGAAVVSAHLARFGRTVAEQALDGIAGRLRAPRTAGMQKTLAGPRLNVPREGDTAQGAAHAEARRTGFENEYESQNRDLLHLPNAREMLLGSSFTLTTQEAEETGGSFALWGRASANRFDGATNDGTMAIGLDGEVLTGLVGADYARGDWLVGLALTHSLSEGGYTSGGANAGEVDASLTAALPYLSLQANPRLKFWGAGGYGIGEVTLKTAGASYRADTDWTMAAAGVRGDLLDTAGNRPALAVVGDGLWMRSTSEEIAALSTADAFVTRLRLGVEASYDFSFDGMGDLTPRLEAGARHDGGDAETGAGMDLGVGVIWDAPVFGLSLDVAGRMLILHENEDFADRGISAAFIFDPSPESERGPSLSLRQAIGGRADGGIEALFATTTPLDGGQIGGGAGMRRTLATAYGFSAFGGRFTASPHAEVDFTERARDYALGWRFVPHKVASDLAFGIKATRREAEALAPVHVFGIEATVRW